MTLDSRKIVVTRAAHQAAELANLIETVGGIPMLYPCIELAAPNDTSALTTILKHIMDYDWIIFTSRNTVHAVHQHIQKHTITVDWTEIKIASIGSRTRDMIEKVLGASVHFVPSQYTGERLAQELPVQNSERILLPQSELAEDTLTQLLCKRGANVESVSAYTMTIGQGGDNVPEMLKHQEIDAITFTSPSTVTNFIQRIQPQTAWTIPAICIGTTTHAAAIDAGFQYAYYPDNFTLDEMVKTLSHLFTEVQK